MPFIRRTALFVSFLLIASAAYPQGIPVGQWRDHFPYRNASWVTEGQGEIYCATPYAAFSYNKQDNSFERLTKITGFSDFGVSTIKFNPYNNSLMIAYNNANIDIVQNKTITNLSDIKRKPIIGNKNINGIHFINQYAYLACGFGIVVFDTDKKEVKDTYYIGSNGSNLNVRDITSDATKLYAATDSGVYRADLSNPNLANFTAWSKFTGLPKGTFNTIVSYSGKILANYSKRITTGGWNEDTIFVYNGSNWGYFTQLSGYMAKNLEVTNNTLVASYENDVRMYDNTLAQVKQISNYGFAIGPVPRDAITDGSGTTWIADGNYGLVKAAGSSYEAIFPNGPSTIGVLNMKVHKDYLWLCPGNVTGSYSNTYNYDGLSRFSNESWSTVKEGVTALDTIFDLVNLAIDPDDEKHVFVTTWSRGVIELQDGVVQKVYNEKNSTLIPIILGTFYTMRTYGIAFDEDKNLWMNNTGAPFPISVRKPDGTWKAIDFTAFVNTSAVPTHLLITKGNQKWILLEKGEGILVYNDNGTMVTATPANTKKLNQNKGNGGLPSNGVYSIAEDQEGEVWVGTDKGVCVFYSPESIFSGGSNWDAQQILIEQDGHVQILFETEVINAITVDGANRKWIGTATSGVYLMSADGQKEIHHFTTENSPLPSNEIVSITMNQNTGEVFFGTLNGIVSYRSTATEGLDDFNNVYAFPNPVRENYDGVIAIRGLVKDADVKITDIAGTLIYKTKALGGQAIWDGKNFKGEKAHTGVYLVFCSNEDGSKTYVTKILFIN